MNPQPTLNLRVGMLCAALLAPLLATAQTHNDKCGGTTTFNGAEIPSADPYRRSASLDLFPAQIIDKVVVDLSGERYVDHESQVRGWFLID